MARFRGGSASNKRGARKAKGLLATPEKEDVVYEDLPIDKVPELHERAVRIKGIFGRLSNNKWEAARELYEVRYSLSYGQWAKWIATELHEILMASQADNYVRAIQRLKKYEEKIGATVDSTVIANLSLSSLIELSRKSTPEFIFNNALKRAKTGPVPYRWIKDEIRTSADIKRAAKQARLDKQAGRSNPPRPEKEGATLQQLQELCEELKKHVWLNEQLCVKLSKLFEDEVRAVWSDAGVSPSPGTARSLKVTHQVGHNSVCRRGRSEVRARLQPSQHQQARQPSQN